MASYEVQFRKSVSKDLDPIPKRDVHMTPEGETVAQGRPLIPALKCGDRTLNLCRGGPGPCADGFALLESIDDGKSRKTRVGDTFAAGSRTFRLLSVETQSVRQAGLNTGRNPVRGGWA